MIQIISETYIVLVSEKKSSISKIDLIPQEMEVASFLEKNESLNPMVEWKQNSIVYNEKIFITITAIVSTKKAP